MGFDIECIIDIHTYPGEYFCPVCRTLVYPNEAFQSQCTHLYCKPCLAHIANGTRACPYDGYLVTEADSKPLMDSDKALAENIGKVKVHCLYFRSGCTWEGMLSDCSAHCSACSFGNSPVICNRCAAQIVHRQVHDHAQTCPGAYGGQQAVGGASGTTASSATTAEVNQIVAQSGPPSQVYNSQNVAAALPGQNPNSQVNANSQAPVAPVNVPTPDQWYQHQYQQYYQQYVGYDPYQQQPNQQYSQFQHQPFQQYQQHPVQVQGQQQSQAYPSSAAPPNIPMQTPSHKQPQTMQPQPQPQPQPMQSQPQPQPQPQPMQPQPQPMQPQQQLRPQLQPVSQAPQQAHIQTQAQGQAQPQHQMQLPPQVQPHVQAAAQVLVPGPVPAPAQALAPNYQVNPQQPLHPQLRPQTQAVTQALLPPPHFAQGMRPPAQHQQVPQYQQSHVQLHHQQASQVHLQPQMHPQPQPQPVSLNLPHVQIQAQGQPYTNPSQATVFPPQGNQSTGSAALPQAPPHPPIPSVSGHHSYQQSHAAQKILAGSSQQYPVHPHPANPSVHPAHVHGQVPQQPGVVMRPQPQVSLPPQQQTALLHQQGQVPGIPPVQHQQFPPHALLPTHPHQNRPVTQLVQQVLPQQYGQQQNFATTFQAQLHQQPVQPQMRPSGPPQLQQAQSYAGRPMMPTQGMHPLGQQFSSDIGPLAHSGPAPHSSAQISTNQNYAKSNAMEHNDSVQDIRSSKAPAEKGSDGEILEERVVTGKSETVGNEDDNVADGGRSKSVIKQEVDDVKSSLDQASGGNLETGTIVNKASKGEGHSVADVELLKQVTHENLKSSAVVNYDKQSQTAATVSGIEGHAPQQSQGSHQGPLGEAGVLPYPGQSFNADEGRALGYYGPPKSFESQSMPHGSALTTQASGRALLLDDQILKDQKSGTPNKLRSGEGSVVKNHAEEPRLFTNGGPPPYSVFGYKDEKLIPASREHNLYPGDPTRPFDQASRLPDKAPHVPTHEVGSKMNPGSLASQPRFLPPHNPSGGNMFGGGPEFVQQHMKPFTRRSPAREYFGSSPHGFGAPSSFPYGTSTFDDIASREAPRVGEGWRSFNHSSGRVGNPFHDGRFPPLSGHHQGDIDGSGNPRFGEFMAPGLIHTHNGSNGVFGPDGPDHSSRGKIPGPGYFPGKFGMGETAGPGAFPGHGHPRELGGPISHPRPPFAEPRGDQFAQFGEPSMHNNYPHPGFNNAGNFSSGMDSFVSWKRKPMSGGWCRICEIDCESVEGLDLHSQMREHHKMAMDMVKSIKLQNKRQRTGGQMVHEAGGRPWKASIVGHGSKP